MRRYIGLLAAASVVLTIGLVAMQDRAPSESETKGEKAAFAPGRILVKIEDKAPADAIVSINRRYGARLEEKIPHSRLSVVDLPEGLSVAEAIERYEASPEVEYAEPDYELRLAVNAPTPNDPSFPKMYNLYNRGQYGGTFDADIDAPEAWNATTGSATIVVAVIDTGANINHRDLKDNIWTNPDEIPGNGKDDDKNGYKDDVHGWDFYNDDSSVFDRAGQDSHGTHVAGTIAATGNNTVGVTGVNWRIKVMPLKFYIPSAKSYVSDAVEALNYAVAEGVKISNNSYGYYDSCGGCYARSLQNAIGKADQAGHLFVTAAMNGGSDYVGDDNDVIHVYPASYNNSNIISVAASNDKDALASFSNYGATSVDLAAPGKRVLSTLPGNKYGYGEGTSVAAPHVTGVAALIKSRFPNLDDEKIKARILRSVDKKASLRGKVLTGGRLNAAKALGANTAPVILNLRPSGKIRDRTPSIRAIVRDDRTNLAKRNIKLFLDGRRKKTFSYDRAKDRLTYRSGKLAYRWHSVRVVVKDGQGLQEKRAWKFRVV